MVYPLFGGVAVITGAARGLGAGIARAAAARGMKLVLADIALDPLQQVADELTRIGVEVIAVQTDVSDPAALDRLADISYDRFGGVRLLVNNAGVEMMGALWDLSAEQCERVVRINTLGPIHGVRAFAGRMIAAGEPAFISNIASLAALAVLPMQTPYALSKHATLALSEGLYLEMQDSAPMIRVSAVLPGPVATGIFDDAMGGGNAERNDRIRAVMNEMIATGPSPDEAAKTILDQIASGAFWISTDLDLMNAMRRSRAAFLSEATAPAVAEGQHMMLGHVPR